MHRLCSFSERESYDITYKTCVVFLMFFQSYIPVVLLQTDFHDLLSFKLKNKVLSTTQFKQDQRIICLTLVHLTGRGFTSLMQRFLSCKGDNKQVWYSRKWMLQLGIPPSFFWGTSRYVDLLSRSSCVHNILSNPWSLQQMMCRHQSWKIKE